ncbi:unnamed protein product [Amoebophrya sp. A120]|nr:unnamed protein product [Amoebophrya sp. A120]|eukprot:GSA120T00007898001.1
MSSQPPTPPPAAATPPVRAESPQLEDFISDREVNKTIGKNNIFRTLWCNIFLVIGSTITFGPVFDKYILQLSDKNWVVGVVESASGMTSLLVFVPVAYLVDHVYGPQDRARLVRNSANLLSVGVVVLVFAILFDSFYLLFPALFLNGVFYELFSSATEALFADSAGVTGDRAGWYVKKQVYITIAAGVGPLITLLLAFADNKNHLLAHGGLSYDNPMNYADESWPTDHRWDISTAGGNVHHFDDGSTPISGPFAVAPTGSSSSWHMFNPLFSRYQLPGPALRMSAAAASSGGTEEIRSPRPAGAIIAGKIETASVSASSRSLLERNSDTSTTLAGAGEMLLGSGVLGVQRAIGDAAGAGALKTLPSTPSEESSTTTMVAGNPSPSFFSDNFSSSTWTLSWMHFILLSGVVLFAPLYCFLYGYRDLIQEQDVEGNQKKTEDEVFTTNLTRGEKWIPYLCGLSDFVVSIGAGMTVKFFNLFFIQDYHFQPWQISLLQTAYPLTIAVFTILLGKIAKYCGRAQTSAFAFSLNALCMILLAQLQDVRVLLAIFLIRGGMANGVAPLDRSILMDYTPSSQRGKWNAVESFTSITWSGSAFLGGYIADVQDYRQTFRYTGFIYLVGTLIYSPLLFLVPRKAKKDSSGSGTAASTEAGSGAAGTLLPSEPAELENPVDSTAPTSQSSTSRGEPLLVVRGRALSRDSDH